MQINSFGVEFRIMQVYVYIFCVCCFFLNLLDICILTQGDTELLQFGILWCEPLLYLVTGGNHWISAGECPYLNRN